MNKQQILYGVVASTPEGSRRLRAGHLLSVLPSTFPPSGWWVDPKGGVALSAPQLTSFIGRPEDGRPGPSAIALAGHVAAAQGGARPVDGGLLGALRRQEAGLASLRGEFALAFWDGDAERLVLARDQLGQRNIFVRTCGSFTVFCSELGPLLGDRSLGCALDLESACHYLACGLPPPGKTLARDISRVPAAHALIWQAGQPWLLNRYWTPLGPAPHTLATDSVKSALEAQLDGAIATRLDPRRPQAVLLSGGIDSSYIAVTLARRAEVHAYTIEFAGGHGVNETDYARLVTEACGARHCVIRLDVDTALELLEATLTAAEPCSAWATLTHRHLLRAIASDGHELVWSGLGADEVFGGYQRFLDFYFRMRHHVQHWPHTALGDAFAAILGDDRRARRLLYPGVAGFFSDQALAQALHPRHRSWHYGSLLQDFYRECRRLKPTAHLFEMMVAHECQRRIPDLLFVDFEGVAHELGVRTVYPFLDPDVVQKAACLGASSRFYFDDARWWNKKALREIAAARLPAPIIRRYPTSYTAPFAEWLRLPEVRSSIFARLGRSPLFDVGFIRRPALARLKRRFEQYPNRRQPSSIVHQLWALLTLAGWHDTYVARL